MIVVTRHLSTICVFFAIQCTFGFEPSLESSSVLHQPGPGVLKLAHHRTKRFDPSKKCLTQAERGALLAIHNQLRAGVAQASNMDFMVWNNVLEQRAQEEANLCNFAHGQPSDFTTPTGPIGQNLWAGNEATFNATGATLDWYNEVANYNFQTNTCGAGDVCGHYTQVVWATSNTLGCGVSACSSITGTTITNGYIFFCNYWPAGNYVGESPYQAGTACSHCDTSYPQCANKLCQANPMCSVVTECTPTNMTNCLCEANSMCSVVTEGTPTNMTNCLCGDALHLSALFLTLVTSVYVSLQL